MIRKIINALDKKERDLRASFGHDITDPKERKKSQWHVKWLDHGVLRSLWHNFSQVANGVYRSNHPDHARFAAYKAKGIKAVLNLRGVVQQPHYLFEVESCEQLGLELVTVHLSARQAPPRARLLALLDAFETISRPFLMHCKSGADRTGLAAVLYLVVHEGKALDEARDQLSFKYLHIRKSETGILDHFFDVYATRNATSPISIVDWIRDEYDSEELTKSFAAKRAAQRFWQGWRA